LGFFSGKRETAPQSAISNQDFYFNFQNFYPAPRGHVDLKRIKNKEASCEKLSRGQSRDTRELFAYSTIIPKC
jgi:hypothetical protein